MTDVLLFHHAQGLTAGVRRLADRLRAGGHQVTVPDLYEGATFDTLDAGVAHAQEVGFDAILERGRLAAEGLPAEIVYIGLSLGVLPAQMLAQTRAGAKGAVLVSAAVPAAEFERPWPDGASLQIHLMEDDALVVEEGDLEAARELAGQVEGAELFLYPGRRHLFVDSSLPDYDEPAATRFEQRVLGLLERVAL